MKFDVSGAQVMDVKYHLIEIEKHNKQIEAHTKKLREVLKV